MLRGKFKLHANGSLVVTQFQTFYWEIMLLEKYTDLKKTPNQTITRAFCKIRCMKYEKDAYILNQHHYLKIKYLTIYLGIKVGLHWWLRW